MTSSKIPWGQIAIGLGLAFQFFASILGMTFLGNLVDRIWGAFAPWGIISGLIGGFVLATYQLLKGLKFFDKTSTNRSSNGRDRT